LATRDHVLQVLQGREASRIRFTFPSGGTNITVNWASFQAVARAIRRGTISVTVSTAFPAGVGAQYDGSTNSIITPPVIGRVTEGLLLHECTHASFDLASLPNLPAVDDEAASYVVDALYFRMTGLARPRWNAQLHAFAGLLADGLLREYQAGNTRIPAVQAVTWHLLRAFIITNPVYMAGPAGTGGAYMHNG
jgi:hypothetical protein